MGASSADRPAGRWPVAGWLGRAAAGLGLGWVWASCVSAGWVALAVAAYGDLDRAADRLRGEPWAPAAFGGFFASMPASWVGGLVGPLVPAARGRARRPVLGSSLRGGGLGAVLGAAAGLLAGWIGHGSAPRSMVFVWVALGLGVAAGLGGGWLGGRAARA